MYREVPFPLGGAVIWTRDAAPGPRQARIFPDGCIDLIWSQGVLFVAGPDTAARLVTTPAGVDYVAVRFAPGQAPGPLRTPADALRDSQVALDALWPARSARKASDEIAAARDQPRALARFVSALLTDHPVDPLAREVARRLRSGQAVEQVAEAVRLSPRQLRRRCLTVFGYGPKTLGRVLRFDRALALARGGMRLADVAASAGYADQAHLARDVRALAGITLGQVLGADDRPD